MGAIKPRKSENVKNRIYRDESDKINGTFWDRKFEGPKSTVNGFINELGNNFGIFFCI